MPPSSDHQHHRSRWSRSSRSDRSCCSSRRRPSHSSRCLYRGSTQAHLTQSIAKRRAAIPTHRLSDISLKRYPTRRPNKAPQPTHMDDPVGPVRPVGAIRAVSAVRAVCCCSCRSSRQRLFLRHQLPIGARRRTSRSSNCDVGRTATRDHVIDLVGDSVVPRALQVKLRPSTPSIRRCVVLCLCVRAVGAVVCSVPSVRLCRCRPVGALRCYQRPLRWVDSGASPVVERRARCKRLPFRLTDIVGDVVALSHTPAKAPPLDTVDPVRPVGLCCRSRRCRSCRRAVDRRPSTPSNSPGSSQAHHLLSPPTRCKCFCSGSPRVGDVSRRVVPRHLSRRRYAPVGTVDRLCRSSRRVRDRRPSTPSKTTSPGSTQVHHRRRPQRDVGAPRHWGDDG